MELLRKPQQGAVHVGQRQTAFAARIFATPRGVSRKAEIRRDDKHRGILVGGFAAPRKMDRIYKTSGLLFVFLFFRSFCKQNSRTNSVDLNELFQIIPAKYFQNRFWGPLAEHHLRAHTSHQRHIEQDNPDQNATPAAAHDDPRIIDDDDEELMDEEVIVKPNFPLC